MLTAKKFQLIYDEYQDSGLTIRSFCANRHIRESKFYYWHNRMKNQLPPRKGFVPVVIEDQRSSRSSYFASPQQNQQQSIPSSANVTLSCEIGYPGGVTLKINGLPDPEILRSLLLLHQ